VLETEGEGIRAVWVGCGVKGEWERESSVERGPKAGHCAVGTCGPQECGEENKCVNKLGNRGMGCSPGKIDGCEVPSHVGCTDGRGFHHGEGS